LTGAGRGIEAGARRFRGPGGPVTNTKRHGKPSKDALEVKESELQFRGPVKVRGRGGNLVLFEDPMGVSRGLVNIQVTQCEGGEGGRGKDNIWGNGAGVVETTFCAVRIDDREAGCGWVEKTVRGEEVQCHNITPSEEAGQEGNRDKQGPINIKGDMGLAAPVGRGENTVNKLKEGGLPL